MTVTGVGSLPALILTHEPFIISSLLCPAEEGSDTVVLVDTWHLVKVNAPHKEYWQTCFYQQTDSFQKHERFIFFDMKQEISSANWFPTNEDLDADT